MLRVGLLTSGGDCQALNATMRGIVKTLTNCSPEPVEFYGFEDGYQGLIYSRFRVMTSADFSGILTRGGTILGTSRTPFKLLDTPEADGVEKVPAMVHTYHKLKLDCLFMLGGNVVDFGAFLGAIINFLITAAAVFAIVKSLNALNEMKEKAAHKVGLVKDEGEEEAPAPRLCPFCRQEIPEDATRCPHCTSKLDGYENELDARHLC